MTDKKEVQKETRVIDLSFRVDRDTDGIGGFLILVAGWNIANIVNIFANLSTISQLKFALLNSKLELPEAFYNAASSGYKMLIPVSLIMLYTFFKTKKIYKYLEIANLIIRTAFLGVLIYILEDFNILFTPLANNLFMTICVTLVIIIYLFASKRVKATFLNPLIVKKDREEPVTQKENKEFMI